MRLDALVAGTQGNLADVPALARAVESLGFDALWSGESAHDGFLRQPLIAEHTQRIQFGTGVAIAFARSPFVLAQAAWDLAAQSGGRFMLGLGTQVKAHIERRFGMPWSAPAPKLRDTILAIRALWDCWQYDKPLDYHGEFYHLTLMPRHFNPGPISNPHIPVFVAGVNRALCEMAGEVADGLHVHSFQTMRYLREVTVPAVEAGAAKAGRSRSSVQLLGAVFTVSDDDQRERVRSQLAFYASTPSYRGVLAMHGWEEIGERLSHLARLGRWDDMPAEIPDEVLESFAVVASPEELPAKLVERYEGLLDRITLYEAYKLGDDERRWRAFVEGIHASTRNSS